MAVEPNDIIDALRETDRPVMSVSDLMEATGENNVTVRETARAMARIGQIEQIQVGNACAFYLPDSDTSTESDPTAERVRA